MASLARARCFNHAHREAAARCPACARFFCRECVSEHEQRMLCAACLVAARENGAEKGAYPWLRTTRLMQFVAAVAVLWFVLVLAGQLLLTTPTSYHPHRLTDKTTAMEDQ